MSLHRYDTAEGLDRLSETIHDCWFDLNEVVYPEITGRFQVHLAQSRRRLRSRPDEAMVLIIEQVLGYEVSDSAKIRYYDIKDVTYEEPSQRVILRGCSPITLRIRVRHLDIRLLVPSKQRKKLFGGWW
jgi:hypothetical protein